MRASVLLLSAPSFCLGLAVAGAQTEIPVSSGTPASTEGRERRRAIEEIVVTAQKREESLQDVPISVTAITGDDLDMRGVGNPQDLQRLAPGLTYSTAVGFSLLYLRGVGSDAFLMADPSVALYIDGIYFPFAQGLAQSFGAVDRVEVLKGPQGTLFGRNAVGGAISIVTRSPGPEPEVSALLGTGSYDRLQGRLHVNVPFGITPIPFGDTLAVSLSTFYEGEDNYYQGTTDGREIHDEISKGIRAKLQWTPVESFSLAGGAFRYEHAGPGSLITPNSDPTPVAELAGVRRNTSYRADLSAPVFADLGNTVFYGQAEWLLDWFDLKLLGSTQDIQTHYGYDYDGSDVGLVSHEAKNQYADVQTAEFQILSNETTWLSDWVTWIGGVYYFTSRQGFDPVDFHVLDLNLATGEVAGLPLALPLVEALRGLGVGTALPTGQFRLRSLIDTDSIAGFGQATAHLTRWFSLTFGARYQVEERAVVASSSAFELDDGSTLPFFDFSNGQNHTTTSLKPKVSLEFRPFDDLLAYVSYQQAIKSATYNVVTLYDPPDFVEPEDLDAWEVGAKTTWLDGLLSFSGAGFWYELENQQVQFVSVAQGGAVSFENAGSTRLRGIDFDLAVQLAPQWVSGLVFTANGAYLDAVYTKYVPGRGYDEETGLAFTDGDFTGNRPVRTPELTGLFGLTKTFWWGLSAFDLGGDVYYNTGYYYSPQNTPGSFQDAYSTADARVSYLYEPWRLRLTAFGRNLTDTKHVDGQFSTDFGILSHLARPATYGLRISWGF